MANMGWQDFSFVRDGDGCIVCSPAEAAELIANGALTATTPITIFLDDGRRKAMIAGDWPPLGLAKAAPPASPPALVPAAGEPVDSDALDAARQELASVIAQVSTSTAAVVGAAAAKAADAAPSAEAPVEPEEAPAPEPPPAPVPPRPTLVPPVPKPLPPPGPGKGWVVALTILALIGAVIVYGMIRNAKADEVRVVVTSTANVRDKPTAENSKVKFSYQAGQELTGRWVPGLVNTDQRWLEFEADGQTLYVWNGNLREVGDEEVAAAALDAVPTAETAPNAAVAVDSAGDPVIVHAQPVTPGPPLSRFAGRYPSDRIDGVSFWTHPAVRRAVRESVPLDEIVDRILEPGVESPIVGPQNGDGRYYAQGCEPHNCGAHNWSVSLTANGGQATICYYDEAALNRGSGYYTETSFVNFQDGSPEDENGCFGN